VHGFFELLAPLCRSVRRARATAARYQPSDVPGPFQGVLRYGEPLYYSSGLY
jgi:hypothetical protein